MGFCSLTILKSIELDCSIKQVGGLEPSGWIINREDIDFASSSDVVDGKLDSIVLKTGKKAFTIAQPPKAPFTGTTTTMEEGTYQNTFTNNIGFVVLDNNPQVIQKIINPLADGQFVVILENKCKDIAGATGQEFQLYGWYQGLTASAIEQDKYSEDTEGGWAVTLTESRTPVAAAFVFDTDYATTKAMLDALV